MDKTKMPPGLSSLDLADIMAGLSQHLQESVAMRKAFSNTDLFRNMVATFTMASNEVAIDTEMLSYGFEQLQRQLGWEHVTREEVDLFFDVVTDLREQAEAEVQVDEQNPFEHQYFQQYGLHAFVMYGQGCFMRISNRPLLEPV